MHPVLKITLNEDTACKELIESIMGSGSILSASLRSRISLSRATAGSPCGVLVDGKPFCGTSLTELVDYLHLSLLGLDPADLLPRAAPELTAGAA